MTTVRIALANIPFPSGPEDSVSRVEAAVAKAGAAGALVVCFPEGYIPGYRQKPDFLAGRNGLAVRDEIRAFIRAKLKPGGLAMVSYNAMPGWAHVQPIRRIMRAHAASVPGNSLDKARAANMTKDAIKRAIDKGTGGGGGESFEDVVYEGYGPAGVAIVVVAMLPASVYGSCTVTVAGPPA